MGLIASMKGSHTHPAKADRLTYIASGWNNAGGLMENTAIAEKKSNMNIDKPAVVKQPRIVKQPAVATTASRPSATPVRTQPRTATTQNTRSTSQQRTTAVRTAPVKKQPAVAKAPAKKKSILDEKYIASDAYFSADPKGKYYITNKGHLVQVDDTNIYMVGRLAQSNREGYSLMLSDKHYNYLYIADGGSIVNGAGTKVGYLKIR
jgi:hypothetical protein